MPDEAVIDPAVIDRAVIDRAVVDRAFAGAQQQWPDLALDRDVFRAHVGRLALGEAALADRAADVFLVAAVLAGVPNAHRRFDQQVAQASVAAGRVDPAPVFVREVEQELRVTLLTDGGAKLLGYSGAGALVNWLRVVAVRVALNLKRADRARPVVDDAPDAVLDDRSAPWLKAFYLDDLKAALEVGFERLTPRERTLLRLHFVDGLNIDRIGVICGAHRATVARWLVAIRRQLFDHIKSELATKHGLDSIDVKSLYRAMEREVGITISRVLQA
jgi:RNA polymerase sigma-70 factor (ECF subfamily)